MTNALTKTFSPTTDQGGLDTRFNEDLRIIFQSIGADVYEGLNNFKRKTSELEQSYGGYATRLCLAFFKRINHLDKDELDGSNQYRWKTKLLRKSLREGLKETGFKPSKVSKLIGAAEFISLLNPNDPAKDWIESPSVGSVYVLSRMDPYGLQQAIDLSKTSEWNRETDTFDLVTVTKSDLEQLQSSHPKDKSETRGRNSRNDSSFDVKVLEDPVSLEAEEVEETETELIEELCILLEKIVLNTNFILGGYNRPEELVEKLQEPHIECVLTALANIATQKPKYKFTTHQNNK